MAFISSFVHDIWYLAALSPELAPGAMKHVTIAEHPIVVGRGRGGKIFALRDICPHRAAPLSAGKITEDGEVECPYHGWRFGLDDGGCTHIPSICSDHKSPAEKINVRTYPVREDGNLIWVYIAADGRKAAPTIDPPKFPMAKTKPLFIERLTLDCHFDHAVIGLIDPAHVPFLHQQWWWRTGKDFKDKAKKFAPIERGFSMVSHTPSSNSVGYKLLGGAPTTEIGFRLPGVRTETISLGSKTLLSLTVVTPINQTSTEITQVFFTDIKVVKLLKPILKPAARVFLGQDGHMISLQAKSLKHDPGLMLVGDADQQAKWYYLLKKEWAKSRDENRDFINPVKSKTLHWRS